MVRQGWSNQGNQGDSGSVGSRSCPLHRETQRMILIIKWLFR
jgi:hypothetical protein